MLMQPFLGLSSATVRRRAVLGFALAAALTASAGFSVPGYAADPAAEPVQRLGLSLVRLSQSGGTAFAQRCAQLAPVVDQTFDLQAILRTSVGPHWNTMSPAEQSDLMAVFRQYTVASFVANFDKYRGDFGITGVRQAAGDEKVVDSKIGDTQLSYLMRQGAAGWRVIDVLADGTISHVAVQRSDFHSTLMQGGSRALITSLQRKISDLSAGGRA